MAFEKLPLEINELIASFLTDDHDLCRFTLLCHVTHEAVHSHHCTVWRDRFDAKFDLPPGKQGFALKKEYQIRQKVLSRGFTGIISGDSQEGKRFIHVLRNLIVESFANGRQDPSGKPVSCNLRHLHSIVRRSRLLDYAIRWIRTSRNIDPTILVFRLLFSHLAFELGANSSSELNLWTEHTLFADNVLRSLFRKRMTTINILLLVHIVDFFKKYLKSETTSEIFPKFQNLAEDKKPNMWQEPLRHGTGKLGRSWKGTYAYLDYTSNMHTRRSMMSEQHMKPLSFDYGEDFKTLELEFAPAECVPWPQVFEDHLHSIPQSSFLETLNNHHESKIERSEELHPWEIIDGESSHFDSKAIGTPAAAKVEEGRDFLPFIGTGIDDRPFRCSGIVHALPEVQGIPGWQRITFMKYFTGADPASLTDPSYPPFYNVHEDSPHWAYEGVVLPGGHMMLGRWWNPMERSQKRKCTGPFIFWNVPNTE